MSWSSVGHWIKDNAGSGTALVGSLLTGNIPGAIAAGVSLVSQATGSDNPAKVLEILQTDPQSVAKLKELYYENEHRIRTHIEEMYRLELEDKQAEHHETQRTIRGGDKAEDRFVRWTRPGQSWLCLFFAIVYVLSAKTVAIEVVLCFMTLPYAYAGLRQVGKTVDSMKGTEIFKSKSNT